MHRNGKGNAYDPRDAVMSAVTASGYAPITFFTAANKFSPDSPFDVKAEATLFEAFRTGSYRAPDYVPPQPVVVLADWVLTHDELNINRRFASVKI